MSWVSLLRTPRYSGAFGEAPALSPIPNTAFDLTPDVRGNDDHGPLISLYNDIFNANLDTQTLFEYRMDINNFARYEISQKTQK